MGGEPGQMSSLRRTQSDGVFRKVTTGGCEDNELARREWNWGDGEEHLSAREQMLQSKVSGKERGRAKHGH